MESLSFDRRLPVAWTPDGLGRHERGNITAATHREARALATFTAAVDALGDLRTAPPTVRRQVLSAMRAVSQAIDLSACQAPADHYGRRLLVERPAWSLAAIMFRYGQMTGPHDHEGWGGAVTVRGIERERRFLDENGVLIGAAERDYRPGMGYAFDPADIHQVSGADPLGVTVALHFLVKGDGTTRQAHPERPPRHGALLPISG